MDFLVLLNTLLGTGLVAAGASALNQLLERDSDAHMRRTENRPLPSGRMQPAEVLIFGLVLSAAGLAISWTLAHLLPVVLGHHAGLLCLGVHAAERRTTLNTLIGAVPGSAAAGDRLDGGHRHGWTAGGGAVLDLFLWQVPHFLAIAWIYREDYGQGGAADAARGRSGRNHDGPADADLRAGPDSGEPAARDVAASEFRLCAAAPCYLAWAFSAPPLVLSRGKSMASARRVLHVSLIVLAVVVVAFVLAK